jgi:uncharacterized DUF497 family protein
MRFDWSEPKNRANQKKHGIAFEVAAWVFDDPRVIFRKDRIVDGEQRWHAIGMAEKAVLLVVYTYPETENDNEEIARIISIREADKQECRIYFEQRTES